MSSARVTGGHRGRNTIRPWYAIGVTLALLVFLGPLVWFVLLAFKPPTLTFTWPPPLVWQPTIDGFTDAFSGNNLGALFNSLIVATGCTLGCLLLGIPAAYAFGRLRFRGRRETMIALLSLRMAPPIAVLFPFYLLMRNLGLVGSLASLVLINIVVNLPLFIWLFKDFLAEVPDEIEESALVDGCSRPRALIQVLLPIAAPGLAVATLFTFIFTWNEFLFALVLSDADTRTLTVVATSFWTNVRLEWNQIAAIVTVTVLPPMLIALALGKYVVRGLAFGAVKE